MTRARVVSGDPDLAARIEATVAEVLSAPREPDRLLRNVADMRARIAREHEARSLWEVKHLRGGLVDLEFLAQYWQLRHAAAHPEVLSPNTAAVFRALADAGLLAAPEAQALDEAAALLRHLQALLRLTADPDFDEAQAPAGLQARLAAAGGCPDFPALKARLEQATETVRRVFAEVIEAPAAAVKMAEPG